MTFSIQQIYRNHVMVLCAIFAVTITVILLFASYLLERRDSYVTLETQAKMVALSLAVFDMPSSGASASALKPVLASPMLLIGCVTDNAGNVRAMVRSPRAKEDKLQCRAMLAAELTYGLQRASADIIRAQFPKPTGKVVLFGKVPSLWSNALAWLTVGLLLALLLALAFWLFGERMRVVALKPIRHIASTAQRVSLYKDYSLRVVPGALEIIPEEVQSLTDSFNAMLKEIEDRDSRLSRKSAELDRARYAAESASSAKSQFLANVSHELRTPLNAIIGFSSMLSDQQFGPMGDPKYVEYARDIQDSGKHLLDVINDILDLSKAETGRLTVTFASLNLGKIIEKALRIIAGHAHNRKVDIYTDLPDKMPKIIADPVRLIQILLNLLSNAIKFSHESGKVTVRARAEQGRQGIYYFTLTIEDEGIGMNESELRNVFAAFNQAEMGLNRKYEGAGLGLPLTKRLVELHHGKIKIESSEGKGTIVTVRLTSDPALLD